MNAAPPAPAPTAEAPARPVQAAPVPPQPPSKIAGMDARFAHAASLPVIDENQFGATERTMGHRFPAFASLYIRDVQRYAGEVAAGIEAGSGEAIIAPAHALKSSSRILGATRAGYWAEMLETRARQMQNSHVELPELVALAQAMTSDLSDALQELSRRATASRTAKAG
jgi:HPt (histidine-containing phosphotransfer) domain-containing protein